MDDSKHPIDYSVMEHRGRYWSSGLRFESLLISIKVVPKIEISIFRVSHILVLYFLLCRSYGAGNIVRCCRRTYVRRNVILCDMLPRALLSIYRGHVYGVCYSQPLDLLKIPAPANIYKYTLPPLLKPQFPHYKPQLKPQNPKTPKPQ